MFYVCIKLRWWALITYILLSCFAYFFCSQEIKFNRHHYVITLEVSISSEDDMNNTTQQVRYSLRCSLDHFTIISCILLSVPAKILPELSSEDMAVREGETVTLICNVTGIPMPTVTWYRHKPTDDDVIKDSEFCPGTNSKIYLVLFACWFYVIPEVIRCIWNSRDYMVSIWYYMVYI